MEFLALIVRSAFRNRLRAVLTSVGVAVAIIAFLFLRTFIAAWYAGVESAGSDRLVVRNKISIIFPMPLSYLEKVKQVPGVTAAGVSNWFGGVYIDEKNFFAQFGVSDNMFDLYPEMILPPEQKQAYMQDKSGAIVGRILAEKYKWKIGDKVVLKGAIYPGDWEFTVRGIYTSNTKGFDVQSFWFHWDYLNDRQVLDTQKNQAGILILKVADASQSSAITQTIDKMFHNSPAETRTESEKAFNLEFISMASTVIDAIRAISIVVLLILMLILANTLAMATRERTTEYAVMRAIGFRPTHVVWLVIGEGFVIALTGVLIGVGLATPVLQFFSQIFSTYLGAFLGDFKLDPELIGVAIVVSLALGMFSSALPAFRASRLRVADALRRVE